MPAKLAEESDKLVVKLVGTKLEFADQLATVKLIAGRRYNPDDKQWEFPNDLETLLKIVSTLEPDMPVELLGKIKKARAKLAEELVTQLPDDAELLVPWADRLAPKQRSGVEFLVEHPHAFLADEMGAGKTAQAISAVYERAIRVGAAAGLPEGAPWGGTPRVLVVAPNSVTGVWVRELEKWAGASAAVIDGTTSAKRDSQVQAAWDQGKWIVVNWEKLRLMPKLATYHFDAIIADESHRAKNRKAQQTRALWKLKAPIQFALSGTPIMNEPGELWALLHWLRPEQYTSYWSFFYNYTDYYQGYRGKPVILGVKNSDALRFELADKMVRRTKREIHKDIPEKLPPQVIELEMKPKQKKLYEEAVKAFWLEIAQEFRARDEADHTHTASLQMKEAMESDDLETLKLLIPNSAARLVRQRQIASSPAILGGPDESSKLDALVEIITDHPDKPFVVFAWYKDTVRLIVERLRKKKVSVESFTGDTPQEDREPLAQSFQAGDFRVIVLTIMTGGAGIDLFRASTCIFAEQDWVPANNNQAIDRLHRKGQKDDVQAIFLQSADTVETGRIAPKNRTKEFIVTSILGDDS
jgi:SNF2 family DNA or RNA helicase